MPSSASTSLMIPRFLTKTSTKASWSALRRWKRPSWKRPSIWVSQFAQWSRVTASSSPQTGQRPMTGCSITRKAPSFRRSSDVTPALEARTASLMGLINYHRELILSMFMLIMMIDRPNVPDMPETSRSRSMPGPGQLPVVSQGEGNHSAANPDYTGGRGSAGSMDRYEQDAALVGTARGGDRAAFAALLARYQPLLLAMCRHALGDDDRAEDAAQEAVLQALLSLDRLRQPERFGSWLVGIGLNVCRRWHRGRGREGWSWEAMLGGRRLPEPVDATSGPADLAEAAELREWVHRAVAGLPPGQRAAVMLHYLAGLPQAETAAHLGVEVGTVKTRLHKARANLRRSLWRAMAESAVREA